MCVCLPAVTNAIVPRRRALALFPTAPASVDYKHNSCIVRACARRCVGPACARTCALISCTPACVLEGGRERERRGQDAAFAEAVCHPSSSLSSDPGWRPTMCSVTVLC